MRFFPFFNRMCLDVMKRCGMNLHDQHERGMTNLFRSSLFMVSLTDVMLALTEGLFPTHQYCSALLRLTSVLMELGHPTVITRAYC